MEFEGAVHDVVDHFPFKRYISLDVKIGAYQTIASTARRFLEPSARILDFGSGPCDKAAILQKMGFNCSACDDLEDDWHRREGNREKIAAFAQECGVDFRLLSGGPLPFDSHFFDMVMLHDVLEHLHDSPRDLCNNLLEFVKPEGFLFITVPNAVNIRKRLDVLRGRTNLPRFAEYYWYPGHWRGHVREYVRGDLMQLADFLNLDILELSTCDNMTGKLSPRLRPIYRLMTGIFPDWKDTWLLVARKNQSWEPRRQPSSEDSRKLTRRNYE